MSAALRHPNVCNVAQMSRYMGFNKQDLGLQRRTYTIRLQLARKDVRNLQYSRVLENDSVIWVLTEFGSVELTSCTAHMTIANKNL
jgi:hypothetical protein